MRILKSALLLGLLTALALTGCQALHPTATETSTPLPAPTMGLVLSTARPTLTPTAPLPSATPTVQAMPSPTITPTSGVERYAVILVEPGDELSVREGPGTGYRVVAALPYDATDVLLTGQKAQVDKTIWVEVQRAADPKVKGWVNAYYLTRYVSPVEFCNDQMAATLIERLAQAILSADGKALAALVSPVHGVDIWLWRSAWPINFDQAHARWVFNSTYQHNWGASPASGLDTKGSFQEAVLPNLRDALANPHEVRCNERSVPGLAESFTWPERYKNINLFKVYKPGTPGTELDWRVWLVGVEWVGDQPYLFALIHFQWEP